VDYGDGETQSYSFDAMGNRTAKSDTATPSGGSATTVNESYSVDAANRLTGKIVGGSASTVTSDANGNTLTDGTRTNTWDSQNRLVQCVAGGSGTSGTGTGSTTSQFVYGSDGMRKRGTVTASDGTKTRTDYVYDGQMMVEEVVQHFNAVGSALDSPTTVTYFQGPQGPLYRKASTTTDPSWYVYDGLGSVVGEVSVTGCMTAGKLFDVYGATRGYTGTPTTRQGFVGGLGHETDDETGLVYMRARYYDPSSGRFVSEDPSHNGTNWFVYCSDNPVSRYDSNGRQDHSDQGYSWEVADQWLAGILLTLGLALIGYGLKACAAGYALLKQGQILDLSAGLEPGLAAVVAEFASVIQGTIMQIQGAGGIIAGVLEVIMGAATILASYEVSINSDTLAEAEKEYYGNTPGRF
jgi:RHS repeat-associated protein